MDKERRCRRHSDGGAQQEDAARHSEVGASEPTNLEGHQLGETEAAQGELLHTTQEPGGLVNLGHVRSPMRLRGS